MPTIYTAINLHDGLEDFDLSSLKFAISGGASLPGEVKAEFERLTGCKLVEGYGLSETSPVATCNPVEGPIKPGSIGLPMPGTEIEMRDLENPSRAVPLGERGEICIKGPQVMAGYWKRPDATAETMVDGFLRSGDVGIMDQEGFSYLVDRIKDVIVCGGYKVYPLTIEEAIYPARRRRRGHGHRRARRLSGRGCQGLCQAQGGVFHGCRRAGRLPQGQALADRDARSDRGPRRTAQDHDRQTLQEGAGCRGAR